MTSRLAPSGGQVHIWRVGLSAADANALGHVLSEDERDRATWFRFDPDRARYVVARAALRNVLGDYLGAEPASLAFAYTEHRKPYLPGAAVSFNLSHSGDIALIAIADGSAVGVDVERLAADVNFERLGRRFFSASEKAAFLALRVEERTRAFFTCWTRKEAFIKGVGEGLSIPLADFDVPVRPDEAACVVAFRTDPDASRRWSLADVPVPDGYAAAVALEHPVVDVVCRDWAQPPRPRGGS